MAGEISFDDLAKDYGQYDVKTIDGVTVIDGGKCAIWMTAPDGLRVCMVIGIGDLFGATYQISAHLGPIELHPKHPLPTIN